VFELGIGLGNSCWTDHKLLRKRTNPRELIAILKNPFLYGVANLLHELQIEGLTGNRFQSKKHFTVLMYTYSEQIR